MSNETVIEISDVWKIFGTNARAKAAMGTRLTEFNAVVGVADVRSVERGEIFCIMGPRSTLRHFNRLLEPTAGQSRAPTVRWPGVFVTARRVQMSETV